MCSENGILVLGAYGLAGRAIVDRLVGRTTYPVIAAGRNPQKLQAIVSAHPKGRVAGLVLDATDVAALRKACEKAAFVINAVGPFVRHGADIAGVVVKCGKPYLDCANEQGHYRRLLELDGLAREMQVPMITAAGAIPGISTLVTAYMAKQLPQTTSVDCCWAQFRHAYADSGLASMMGGILESVERTVALENGKLTPVVVGRSNRHFDLPEPFGRRRLMEVPAIDTMVIQQHLPLDRFHTWFYMGDMPTWLLEVVRILKPDRRPWAYQLIEAVMRRINTRDTANAIDSGVGPEGLLHVVAQSSGGRETFSAMFVDGAMATACLPSHIADAYLRGEMTGIGLLTPLDMINVEDIRHITDGVMMT